MFDSKQLHAKPSNCSEALMPCLLVCCLWICCSSHHLNFAEWLLVRQLWLNFMLRREPRSSAPFQIHDSFDVSSIDVVFCTGSHSKYWYYVIYIYIDIRVHLVQFCRLSRHVQTVQVCASNVYLYLLLITVYFCAHLELFSFTSIHSRYSTVQNWCAPKQPYLLYEGRTVSGSCKRSKESKKLQIKIKLHQTSVYIFDLLAPKSSTTRPWKIRKPP